MSCTDHILKGFHADPGVSLMKRLTGAVQARCVVLPDTIGGIRVGWQMSVKQLDLWLCVLLSGCGEFTQVVKQVED